MESDKNKGVQSLSPWLYFQNQLGCENYVDETYRIVKKNAKAVGYVYLVSLAITRLIFMSCMMFYTGLHLSISQWQIISTW